MDTHARAKPFTNAAGGRSYGTACENRLVGGIECKNEVKAPEKLQQWATKQQFPETSLCSQSKWQQMYVIIPFRSSFKVNVGVPVWWFSLKGKNHWLIFQFTRCWLTVEIRSVGADWCLNMHCDEGCSEWVPCCIQNVWVRGEFATADKWERRGWGRQRVRVEGLVW